MTICVSVKTRDGIVLGTDSMSTVTLFGADGQSMAQKTYSNARKLVQIGELPVGVFTYGLGNLGSRTVISHILEYSRALEIGSDWRVEGIAAGLSEHMSREYSAIHAGVEPGPVLGLHVAGYSDGSSLSEEWEMEFPDSPGPNLEMAGHEFRVNWEGATLPFGRLFHGFDPGIVRILLEEGVEQSLLQKALTESPLVPQVSFSAMPLQDAINFAVYVLRTTIGFTSFEAGPATCGGPLQIAVISEEDGFQWVSKPEFRIPEDTNEWA